MDPLLFSLESCIKFQDWIQCGNVLVLNFTAQNHSLILFEFYSPRHLHLKALYLALANCVCRCSSTISFVTRFKFQRQGSTFSTWFYFVYTVQLLLQVSTSSKQFNFIYAVQPCLHGSTLSMWFNFVYAVQLCLLSSSLSIQFNCVYSVQLCQCGSTSSMQLNLVYTAQLCL